VQLIAGEREDLELEVPRDVCWGPLFQGVEQSKEDADSYERTSTVNGQMQTEAWNKASNSGKFGVVVANRFMVEADGNADGIGELKSAVAAIDQDDLQDLVE